MDGQTLRGGSAAMARAQPHRHGGTLRSGAQSGLIAALFVSGLWLWLAPGSGAGSGSGAVSGLVLYAHLAGGLVLVAALAPWLAAHVPAALAKSRRRLFSSLSWALLSVWLVLAVTGLAMAVPAAIWLTGRVWFPDRSVTEALSLLHFWASWPAMAGLVLHLGMRHWRKAG